MKIIMIRKVVLLSFVMFIATAHLNYQEPFFGNSSTNIYSIIASALDTMGTNCRSLSLCRLVERFKTAGLGYNRPELISSNKKKSDETALEVRSYYGAATSPAFYPTFDPISILASLAFLAFLLQSFASLFDRSRSIIPAVISSRGYSNHQYEIPDPMKLILRALDEYEILNNDIVLGEEKQNSILS